MFQLLSVQSMARLLVKSGPMLRGTRQMARLRYRNTPRLHMENPNTFFIELEKSKQTAGSTP